MKIKVGILGYGNLGRGVECAIMQNPDMEIRAVFTRRNPSDVSILSEGVGVYGMESAERMTDEIDVMILCGGSATDLPLQTPKFASLYNVVDSFDNHKEIPRHFTAVDAASKKGGKVSIISSGWDPGIFSINRLYGKVFLPSGQGETFWGRGVSQGHSDAVRRIEGVKDAKQYTIPVDGAVNAVRSGSPVKLQTRDKHLRECFVVCEEGADKVRIENEIKTMPGYFAEYDTRVHFISDEEMKKNHSGLPHGGNVIRIGKTGWSEENSQMMEFKINLTSNPEFTSSILVAYARAAYRMYSEGNYGCKTVLDIPPAYLSPQDGDKLRAELL